MAESKKQLPASEQDGSPKQEAACSITKCLQEATGEIIIWMFILSMANVVFYAVVFQLLLNN